MAKSEKLIVDTQTMMDMDYPYQIDLDNTEGLENLFLVPGSVLEFTQLEGIVFKTHKVMSVKELLQKLRTLDIDKYVE